MLHCFNIPVSFRILLVLSIPRLSCIKFLCFTIALSFRSIHPMYLMSMHRAKVTVKNWGNSCTHQGSNDKYFTYVINRPNLYILCKGVQTIAQFLPSCNHTSTISFKDLNIESYKILTILNFKPRNELRHHYNFVSYLPQPGKTLFHLSLAQNTTVL